MSLPPLPSQSPSGCLTPSASCCPSGISRWQHSRTVCPTRPCHSAFLSPRGGAGRCLHFLPTRTRTSCYDVVPMTTLQAFLWRAAHPPVAQHWHHLHPCVPSQGPFVPGTAGPLLPTRSRTPGNSWPSPGPCFFDQSRLSMCNAGLSRRRSWRGCYISFP